MTKRAGRAARKAGAAAEQAGENVRRGRGPMTPARARRMIGVGKAVLPLLAPYALAAAGVARARWDAYRAARLGVTPAQLNAYSGRGGALHARIDQLATALDDLDDGTEAHATTASRRFALETRPRLADLAVAVRAAEQMPPQRRDARTGRSAPSSTGSSWPCSPPGGRPHGLIHGPVRAASGTLPAAAAGPTARRLRGATRPALGVAGDVTCRWAGLPVNPWTTGPRAGPACCAGW